MMIGWWIVVVVVVVVVLLFLYILKMIPLYVRWVHLGFIFDILRCTLMSFMAIVVSYAISLNVLSLYLPVCLCPGHSCCPDVLLSGVPSSDVLLSGCRSSIDCCCCGCCRPVVPLFSRLVVHLSSTNCLSPTYIVVEVSLLYLHTNTQWHTLEFVLAILVLLLLVHPCLL